MQRVAVLGAGSWGTALAWLLGGKGLEVRLWYRSPEQAEAMRTAGENARYLPGLALPAAVWPTAELAESVSGAGLVVVAVPVSAVRETLTAVKGELPTGSSVALAAKGLEQDSGRRLSEVAHEVLGTEAAGCVGVISGPNLAAEIVRGVPTATVAASASPELARKLQEAFSTPSFRVYTNSDLAGVELGGALKNPIAIAAGIGDGLGFGANTKAGLLTRGLAEMTRLGVAAGGKPSTFSGLSGLGDLMATAFSPLSRNYRLGLALGQGRSLPDAQEALHQVAEGVPTTDAACRLAERLGVEAPILAELREVLFRGKPVAEAVSMLLARPYRDEGVFD